MVSKKTRTLLGPPMPSTSISGIVCEVEVNLPVDVLRAAANQERELDVLYHVGLEVIGQLTGRDLVHFQLRTQMFEDVRDILGMLRADREVSVCIVRAGATRAESGRLYWSIVQQVAQLVLRLLAR